MCTVLAWQTICGQSDKADGIFNQVIGSFNPFCSNDEDPWESRTDPCVTANSGRIPHNIPACAPCPGSC